MTRKIKAGLYIREANFIPDSIDKEKRTIVICWTTGARVLRVPWFDEPFFEELSVKEGHVRLDRLNQGAPFLAMHKSWDLNNAIGVHERAWIEKGKGFAEVKFSSRKEVEPIFTDVCEGILRNVSTGYKTYKARESKREKDKYPTRKAIDWEPHENSLVLIPADMDAQVRNNNSGTFYPLIITRDDTMDEDEIQSDETTPSNTSAKKPPPVDEKIQDDSRGVSEPNLDQIRSQASQEAMQAERSRLALIDQLCRRHDMPEKIREGLISNGFSPDQVRKTVLEELERRNLGAGQSNHIPASGIEMGEQNETDTRREAIANVILHRHNPTQIELKESARQYMHRSIVEIIADSLKATGHKVDRLNPQQIVERGFHSTSDFPIIMGNLSDHLIVESYNKKVKKQTFSPLVRVRNAKTFKALRNLQMGEIPSLEKIEEGGEVTYGSISEHEDQWYIGSFGKGFKITREMLINDEMDLIMDQMSEWGSAVTRLESNLVWAIFKDNPIVRTDGHRLFSPEHKNFADPGSELNIESLDEAEYQMSMHKGHDEQEGDSLDITPEYLVIPSRIKNKAKSLIHGVYTPNNPETVNPFHGDLKIISEARLNSPVGQPDPWYLTCDPSDLPVLWIAYLNGVRNPTIEYQTDFETRSLKVRADIDFGVTYGDWRAVYKNAGVVKKKKRGGAQ